MSECPHCGEPLDDDAEICRHCGSDAETGWNPDTDYYSVDLPEEDYDRPEPPEGQPARARGSWVGPTLVFLALVGFLGAGYLTYSWGVVLPLLFLLLCGALFGHVVREGHWRR